MAILISCVSFKALAPYTPEVSRQQRDTGMSVSAQRLTMKSWGIDRVQPIRRATQIVAVGLPGPGELLAGGDLSFPNIPSWVTLVVGAFFAAVPCYRQIRAMQDKVEQTAAAAIEVVDRVAETAEKIAEDVAEVFPGNESLNKAASRIKAVADEIEEDADKAQAFLRKIDQIEEEMDEAVYSFTKKKSKERIHEEETRSIAEKKNTYE
ncbi:unnamed protein product [Alopecurus aequalis]